MKHMIVLSVVVVVLNVKFGATNTPTESHHQIHALPSTLRQGNANTNTSFSSFGDSSSSSQLRPNDHSGLVSKSDHFSDGSEGGGDHGEGGGGSNERYPLAVIDFERVQTPFIISLWIFCACLGKIGFHMTPKLSHVFPESCMLVVLGVIIGLLLFYTQAASVSPLTADVFFLYLLPPIILDAGYFMPNRLFFDHLFTILVFAVIGTIWNALTIGISMYSLSLTGLFGTEIPVLHMFLFSSLISAVDPVAVLAVFEEIHVEEVLYILVFGESLLNDGVTVVLYHLFEGFSELGEENIKAVDIASGVGSFLLVALGGTAIGIIWGFLTAFVTRFTSQVRVIEPIFVFVMAYLAYLNAEIFHFSGILSITFCGITMKNYVEQNISTKSHTTIKYAMKMLASSSETVIFMFLGVSTVQSKHQWNTWFVIFTILFCSIYRIFGVLIFSTICNRFRVKKITFVDKFVMSYGGLRGAVAFALVITIDPHHIPLQPMFLTATIAMVYFTVFVQGITIKPLVQLLGVKRAEKRTLTMNERLHERTMDYILAGIEDVMGKHGNLRLRNKFKRFNNKYLTPFLVRDNNVIEPKFLETYSQIKMQEAIAYMSSDGAAQNIESFTQLLRNAATHPHLIKNNHGEWNLDVGELEYNPTQRDMNDAKYHHLLSNDYKPIKRHRGSCYKRHAVREDEMQTQTDITHHNMQFYTRQLARNVNRLKKGKKPNNTLGNKTEEELRAAFQQNGSAIKLKSDHMALMMRDNPAFEDDSGMMGTTKPGEDLVTSKRRSTKGPVMAETALPWKRYYDNGTPTNNKVIQRAASILPDNGENSQPTMAEAMLPWKRPEDEEVCDRPVRQSEFPPWASNKEYVNYYSPSNTFLGGIGKHESYPNIREIFAKRTFSNASLTGSRCGSLKDGHMGHKDGSRRGSLKDNPMGHKDGSRRSSLTDNPFGHKDGSRRGSLTDSSHRERTSSCSSAGDVHSTTHDSNPDHPEGIGNSNQYFGRQRSSTGDGSLLNTIIKEEGQPGDTVIIEMSPGGMTDENTRM